MVQIMLVFVLVLSQFALSTASDVVLQKENERMCTLYTNDNLVSIEKTYTTETCHKEQLEYLALCQLFTIKKKQFDKNFTMYRNDNISVVDIVADHDNVTILNNGYVHGYIVDGHIFYDATNTPLFMINETGTVGYVIISLNNHSDFDLSLIIAIHTSILFDDGSYPTKECGDNFAEIFTAILFSLLFCAFFCGKRRNAN